MKFQLRKVRSASPILLALLLAMALLPGAALAHHDPPPVTPPETPSGNQNQNTPPPTGGNQNTPPPTGGNQNTPPPTGGNQNTPPPTGGNNQTTSPPPGGGAQQETTTGHPDAPSTPSSGCVVSHAATPAQLCPVAGGLQYYFIGADGSTSIGPYISPFADLASLYTAGDVLLYSGFNPLTGKSVSIHYLTSVYKIRVSTYYPDTEYDTDKPYTFTVNGSNTVSQIAW